MRFRYFAFLMILSGLSNTNILLGHRAWEVKAQELETKDGDIERYIGQLDVALRLLKGGISSQDYSLEKRHLGNADLLKKIVKNRLRLHYESGDDSLCLKGVSGKRDPETLTKLNQVLEKILLSEKMDPAIRPLVLDIVGKDPNLSPVLETYLNFQQQKETESIDQLLSTIDEMDLESLQELINQGRSNPRMGERLMPLIMKRVEKLALESEHDRIGPYLKEIRSADVKELGKWKRDLSQRKNLKRVLLPHIVARDLELYRQGEVQGTRLTSNPFAMAVEAKNADLEQSINQRLEEVRNLLLLLDYNLSFLGRLAHIMVEGPLKSESGFSAEDVKAIEEYRQRSRKVLEEISPSFVSTSVIKVNRLYQLVHSPLWSELLSAGIHYVLAIEGINRKFHQLRTSRAANPAPILEALKESMDSALERMRREDEEGFKRFIKFEFLKLGPTADVDKDQLQALREKLQDDGKGNEAFSLAFLEALRLAKDRLFARAQQDLSSTSMHGVQIYFQLEQVLGQAIKEIKESKKGLTSSTVRHPSSVEDTLAAVKERVVAALSVLNSYH